MNRRLLEFINYLGISVSEFERRCQLSNGAVSKMGDNTRTSTIEKISKIFPELNVTWLRLGEGDMLRTVTQEAHGNNNTQIANSSNIGNSEVAEKALNELSEMRKLLDKAIQNNKEQAERFFEIINKLTTK